MNGKWNKRPLVPLSWLVYCGCSLVHRHVLVHGEPISTFRSYTGNNSLDFKFLCDCGSKTISNVRESYANNGVRGLPLGTWCRCNGHYNVNLKESWTLWPLTCSRKPFIILYKNLGSNANWRFLCPNRIIWLIRLVQRSLSRFLTFSRMDVGTREPDI